MYYYTLEGETKTRFILDKFVSDPYRHFKTGITHWSHKNDQTGEIDDWWPKLDLNEQSS
jgi:hypothetical protein